MNLTRLVALVRFMKSDLSESYILLTIFKNKMTRETGNVFGREGGGEFWCTVTVTMQNLGDNLPPSASFVPSSICKEQSNSSCVVSVKSVFSFPDRPFYWLLCGWRRCLNCSPTTETAHWRYLDPTDPASTISSRWIGNILSSAQFSNLRFPDERARPLLFIRDASSLNLGLKTILIKMLLWSQ